MPPLLVKLVISYTLTFWVCAKGLSCSCGIARWNLESGLIQENMTKSSQWFLRELRHFSRPWKGEQSTNMASSSRLCKHCMALITDAYFGVTSEAACLLFVSALCFPGWVPASPRESTCKEYYSVLKSLSSPGAAFSLPYTSVSKVLLLQGELSCCLF